MSAFTDATQNLSASEKKHVLDAMVLPDSSFEFAQNNSLTKITQAEKESMGRDLEGKLVVGQAYRVKKKGILVYRAWNSRKSWSRMGQWWTLTKPESSEYVDQYRKDYNICYQWSGLDRLSSAELKVGAVIVVGAGQSAACDRMPDGSIPTLADGEPDSYDVSTKQQVYISDPQNAFVPGSVKDLAKATFGWDYSAFK